MYGYIISGSMGLDKWTFMPAALLFSISSLKALATIAMLTSPCYNGVCWP